jgi:hypothetical protein
MYSKFTENEVEKLIEQAYLNGIATAGIAKAVHGSITKVEGYKKSTAYYEFVQLKNNKK